MRFLLLITAFLLQPAAAGPPTETRIVFLGDSITQSGAYIEFIEAALIAQHPELRHVIIPLGLSSETVSGLSEPGHADGKFPRPSLHERLDRVLEKAKPGLVLACYGMNDGIYFPDSAERRGAFHGGTRKLHEKVTASGAGIIHLTPPVFDPLPIQSRVLPDGLDSYPQPWQGYNQVLDSYTSWLLDQRKDGWEVLDIHGPMNAALAGQRKKDPTFTFSGDGVHPGREGHVLMAKSVLETWGLTLQADGTPDHPNGRAILAAVVSKQSLLRPAWLSYVGHLRPGIKPGLPLPAAEAQAAAFDEEARRLTKR